MLTAVKISAVLIIILVIISHFYLKSHYPHNNNIKLGVSFSLEYAQSLGLDARTTYLAILDDLKVKNLRLPSYWSSLEPQMNQYNFDDLDFLVAEADKHQAKILLTLGSKQPRWPECYLPNWAYRMTSSDRKSHLLGIMTKIVNRYKDSSVIWGWQVENEPFVNFGKNCDNDDSLEFLTAEINLVKQLDPRRPVILTHAGETLTLPINFIRLGDIFGTTLYRSVHDPIWGDVRLFYPTDFYSLKPILTGKPTIITELQAEPWATQPLDSISLSNQIKLFSMDHFRSNINFAKDTGLDRAYLWGVEWWYWMKTKNQPEYWDLAKTLIKK